jgi:hypothetical protein
MTRVVTRSQKSESFFAASLTLTGNLSSSLFNYTPTILYFNHFFSNTMKAKISRGLRSLPPSKDISAREEHDRLMAETAEIEQSWTDTHRWGHTTRTFSGMSPNFGHC